MTGVTVSAAAPASAGHSSDYHWTTSTIYLVNQLPASSKSNGWWRDRHNTGLNRMNNQTKNLNLRNTGACPSQSYVCVPVTQVNLSAKLAGETIVSYWPSTGIMASARIRLNSDYKFWPNSQMIHTTMHEIGHSVGAITHSGLKDSIMYKEMIGTTSLNGSDKTRFNSLYNPSDLLAFVALQQGGLPLDQEEIEEMHEGLPLETIVIQTPVSAADLPPGAAPLEHEDHEHAH